MFAIWGRPVIPSSCFIANGVNVESESSHAANDIMGEVKEYVFRKSVRRSHNQGPVCRWGAPLVVGQSLRFCVPEPSPFKSRQTHRCLSRTSSTEASSGGAEPYLTHIPYGNVSTAVQHILCRTCNAASARRTFLSRAL